MTTLNRRLGAGLLRHAETRPDHIALTLGRRDHTPQPDHRHQHRHQHSHPHQHDFSYQEVVQTARQWAARLVEAAGPRPRRVGVLAARSAAGYVGVAAALFAGAAFVPLSRNLPVRRTRTMLRRSDLDALIVDAASLPQLPELLRDLPRRPAVLLPDTPRADIPDLGDGPVLDAADLAAAAPLQQLPEVGPDDPAYLLFTSGSTGEPKGVPITHANVGSFLDTNQDRYRLTPDDRLTQIGDQTFDLSVFDLFMAWENGARVCAMDPAELSAPHAYLERNGITVWFSVPSVATALRGRGVLTPGSMPGLRWSLFCGEALPRATAECWQAAAPRSTVENLYGPTELTIACTVYRWDPQTGPAQCVHDNLPIGQPYAGLHTLIVDGNLAPVADGSTGELCVAGPQTTPGYWRAPELTAERFFARDGRTYYRTGDLVRLHQGQLVCIGRNDQQVKIDGYRIELGEIEAVLRRSGAREAVCLAWPDPQSITAVISGAADPTVVTRVSAETLPPYMLPASVHTIDALPVNANGKVDRPALRRWLDDRAARSAAGPTPAAVRPAPTGRAGGG